ncbi:MAG: cupin domain-containing protein [Ignavibacteriaceae bacterium]
MDIFKPELNEVFSVRQTIKQSQYAEMVLKKGSSTGGPDNQHEKSDQWLYVVSGEGKAIVNNKEIKFNAGSVLLIEAGDKHEIINTGSGLLQTLNFYTPPAY